MFVFRQLLLVALSCVIPVGLTGPLSPSAQAAGPATRPILVVNAQRLPARDIPAVRTPLGIPEDYKPFMTQLKSGDLLIVAFCFGPIEGIRLTRVVKDRQEGDRGVITRSSQEDELVVMTLRNLTAKTWDVRLQDRVPYSEQEDLRIAWEAAPAPTETDVDDKRGVLEWRFDMAPNTEQEVELSTSLNWPDGKVLQ